MELLYVDGRRVAREGLLFVFFFAGKKSCSDEKEKDADKRFSFHPVSPFRWAFRGP